MVVVIANRVGRSDPQSNDAGADHNQRRHRDTHGLEKCLPTILHAVAGSAVASYLPTGCLDLRHGQYAYCQLPVELFRSQVSDISPVQTAGRVLIKARWQTVNELTELVVLRCLPVKYAGARRLEPQV